MESKRRCYACFRPLAACFCASIPTIDNRTEVLILQHRRERFHPFNTARIVQQALRNSQLLADHTSNLAAQLQVKPRSGLLYPAPPATLISELPPSARPEQLIVLDGTWHHAKTLMRDIPALQNLPRYRLAPATPSRYRIRREPSDAFLSTVEATVAALRILEPETEGFAPLLSAFDAMVERQLAHPRSVSRPGARTPRVRPLSNIPLALWENIENIVVAYGELPAGQRGSKKRVTGPPISWVAQRLGNGEMFSCTLTPEHPLDDKFLGHLDLTRADFVGALSLDEARRRWANFQRPTDIVAVFHAGTAHLYKYLAGHRKACLVLKAVDLNALQLSPPPDDLVAPEFPLATAANLGRAGRRLARSIALVKQLHALAKQHARAPKLVVQESY